jgi:drug/metabolite transporter (DMT)-like permease
MLAWARSAGIGGSHALPFSRFNDKKMLRAAVELSAIGVSANLLSVYGISKMPAVTSELLLGCVHVFVPLQTVFFAGSTKSVGFRTWVGCCLSFAAVFVLSMLSVATPVTAAAVQASPAVAASTLSKSLGPGLLVCAAFVNALGRVRAQHRIAASKLDAETLGSLRFVFMAAFSLVVLLASTIPEGSATRAIFGSISQITSRQWGIMCFNCFLSGWLGSLLQFQALRTITAANAQPYFALSPLWAGIWSYFFLDEPLAPALLIAGGMVGGGALIASTDRHAAVAGNAKLHSGVVVKAP